MHIVNSNTPEITNGTSDHAEKLAASLAWWSVALLAIAIPWFVLGMMFDALALGGKPQTPKDLRPMVIAGFPIFISMIFGLVAQARKALLGTGAAFVWIIILSLIAFLG